MARKKNAFPYPSGMPTLYAPDDDQREAHHPSALVTWPAAWKVGRRDSARWHVSGGALRTADRSPLQAGTVVLHSLLGTRRVALSNPTRASAPARVQFPVLHPVQRASVVKYDQFIEPVDELRRELAARCFDR